MARLRSEGTKLADLGWVGARLAFAAVAGLVLAFLFLPTLIILPLSLSSSSYFAFPPPGWSTRWYIDLLHDGDYATSLWNSVRVGVPAALIATLLGTFAALAVVRGGLRAGRAIGILVIAPLILPQIVLAIGLYPVMARLGIIGTYPAIVIGHAVLCMPLVFISVSAALTAYSPSMELAAMTLGAGWIRTLLHVTFPMIAGGMVVGFVFAFTTSFDELVLAIFLTGAGTRTLPRLLWEKLTFQMTPTVAAATVVIVTLTLFLMFLVALVARGSTTRRVS